MLSFIKPENAQRPELILPINLSFTNFNQFDWLISTSDSLKLDPVGW